MSLTEFARRVRETVKVMPESGRFANSRKAFIFSTQALGGFGMDVAEFGEWLWAAHRAGLVTLVRCDLVSAAPAWLVRRSEIHPGGMSAVYHLIKI